MTFTMNMLYLAARDSQACTGYAALTALFKEHQPPDAVARYLNISVDDALEIATYNPNRRKADSVLRKIKRIAERNDAWVEADVRL